MKKFLESNLFYGILAVIISITLYFYVASSENPIEEKSFPNVNISVTGLAENYLLESEPGRAVIMVSGNRSTLNATLTRDVRAYVDLRNAKPGTERYPVQYSIHDRLTLVYIRPEYIELTIDSAGSKELAVNCQTVNAVLDGYEAADPEINPASITITGPQRFLDQIAQARVKVDLHDRTSPYAANQQVTLLDAEGHEFQFLNRVSVSTENVRVSINISEIELQKNVSVRTALSGNVNEKYNVAGVEIFPSSVRISGPFSLVSPIEFLTTETIDLTNMTDTFKGLVKLNTPSGVTVPEGAFVELTVRVERKSIRYVIEDIPIEILNAPEDKSYGTIPGTVTVALSSYPEIFEAYTVNGELRVEVKAYVDLAGEPADTRDYPLILDVPEDFKIQMSATETVRLYAK